MQGRVLTSNFGEAYAEQMMVITVFFGSSNDLYRFLFASNKSNILIAISILTPKPLFLQQLDALRFYRLRFSLSSGRKGMCRQSFPS